MTTISCGKPYVGNVRVRIEEGNCASAEPRRKPSLIRKLLMALLLIPLMVKAVTYPYVATSGASLGVWTTDYDAAVSASRSSGFPIILCTLHHCDHGCAALLTNIPSELASKSYLVCFNKDFGYPGYRADFSVLLRRFALNSTIGQAVLLFGGRRAGEIAKKYGSTHSVTMSSLIAKMQADYPVCVANGSRNVAFNSQDCSSAVSQERLSFTSSSSAPWQISGESGLYDEYFSRGQSVRSGLISDGGSSWLETTVTGPGWVSFNWFVSSEETYDELSFFVDGACRDAISGEHAFSAGNWGKAEFPIAGGTHKLRWEYRKDSSASEGLDGAWVADVVWIKKQNSFTSYRTNFSSHDMIGHLETYPIVMDPGGASGDQRLYEGLPLGNYPAPTCPYSREGYRFSGWNYYSACSRGDSYFSCKGVDCGGLIGLRRAGSILDICGLSALVATWEPIAPYAVTFNANGGACSMSSKQYASGSTLGTLPTATRSGYAFDGWYTSSSGGTKISASTKVTANVTYYAHWRYDGSVYVATSLAKGSEGMGTVSGGNKSVKGGSTVSLTAKAAKGYVFGFWDLEGATDDEWERFWSDNEAYNPSLKLSVGDKDVSVEAYFMPVEYDGLCVWPFEEWQNAVGVGLREAPVYGWDYERCIGIESGSLPKFSVSGLPPGVKYKAHNTYLCFMGTPTKEGVYWVTYTVKNAGGYQATGIIKWVIGNPRPTDYDNIGLNKSSAAWEQIGGLVVGEEIQDALRVDDWVNAWEREKIAKWTISGLPTGLKLQQNSQGRFVITGMPTKAGKYTLTISATYADRRTVKAVQTVVVQGTDNGSAYVKVSVAPGCEHMGSVSGGGVCAVAGKCTITAKANKGYVFAGWYDEDGNRLTGLNSGDWRKASDSYVVRAWNWPVMTAWFVPQSADRSVAIDCPTEWRVEYSDVGGLLYDAFPIRVDSASLPTVSVSGLPSGCTFDKANMRLVFAKQPQKPGVSKVVIKAKNASGMTTERILYVKVPNLRSDVFEGIEYESAYAVNVGVSDGCRELGFGVLAGWRVTASGLPSGMRLDFYSESEDDYWWTEYTGYARLSGMPTKTGTYTVTLTAKKGGETRIATLTLVVNPLPAWCVGRFNGILGEEGRPYGSFVMEATAAGKLTATLTLAGGAKKTYSANGWACLGDYGGDVYFYKPGTGGCGEGEFVSLAVTSEMSWDAYQLTGEYEIDGCVVGGTGEIYAQRNPFGKVGKGYENPDAHEIVAKLALYGKMGAYVTSGGPGDEYVLSCPNAVYFPPWNPRPAPDVAVVVGQDGMVRLAGRIGSVSVSASAPLLVVEGEPCAYLLAGSKMSPIVISLRFDLENGPNGAVTGTVRKGWR